MKNSNCLNEKGNWGVERTRASAPLTNYWRVPGCLFGDGSAGYARAGVAGGIGLHIVGCAVND
jgi:hypothetical protein